LNLVSSASHDAHFRTTKPWELFLFTVDFDGERRGIFPARFLINSRSFHGLFRNAMKAGFYNMRRSAWLRRPETCDAVLIKNAGFTHKFFRLA
jgi:hypothetical protein